MEKDEIFTILVDHTIPTVLDLLTKRKAFAVINVPVDMADHVLSSNLEKRKVKTAPRAKDSDMEIRRSDVEDGYRAEDGEKRFVDNDDGCFYELLAPENQLPDTLMRRLLFVGDPLHSRDDDDRVSKIMELLSIQGIDESSVAFPTFHELYNMARGWSLRCQVYARDEEEAALAWNQIHLGIGYDKGKYYIDRDRAQMTLSLQEVCAEPTSNSNSGPIFTPTDPANFSVYFDMFEKMASIADGSDPAGIYGDDLLAECLISQGDDSVRCIATEFFSNHNWGLDPTTLLVIMIKANIVSPPCNEEVLRFSHPTKDAKRLSDGKRFYLQSIMVNNDMEPKFNTGLGENKRPDTSVSDDKEWDNLIDFNLWLDMYRKEIALL